MGESKPRERRSYGNLLLLLASVDCCWSCFAGIGRKEGRRSRLAVDPSVDLHSRLAAAVGPSPVDLHNRLVAAGLVDQRNRLDNLCVAGGVRKRKK